MRNNKGYAVGLTSVLRPTLVSNFRYGFTRQGNETTGIMNFGDGELARPGPTRWDMTHGFAAIIPVHTIAEDLNWTKGAHNIQFGGVVRFVQQPAEQHAKLLFLPPAPTPPGWWAAAPT